MTLPGVSQHPLGMTPSDLEAFLHDLTTTKRRARPARRETVRRLPECPVCGETIRHVAGRLTENTTRYVDGVEIHRACLGDGA